MLVQQIIRRYLHTAFGAARIPLGALELAAGQRGEAAWPVRLAYDSFESQVKQLVSLVTDDDVLADEARREADRVADLREAARLDAEADQLRNDAKRGSRAGPGRRTRGGTRPRPRPSAADTRPMRRRHGRSRRQPTRSERARQGADEAAARRAADLREQERAARLETIAEEKAALERERRATKTSADIARTDRKIQASKKTRATKKAATRTGTGATARATGARSSGPRTRGR